MRKLGCLILLVVILLSSCIPATHAPAEGVWACEKSGITLYNRPRYRPLHGLTYNYHLVTIVNTNGEMVAGFALWDGSRLTVHRVNPRVSGRIDIRGIIFAGTYRWVGEEMHFTPTSENFSELTGHDGAVIFRQTNDYAPINPYDWFPHLFPAGD
ncbi:MAG: hypothetical protein FWB71_01245 [Defluviitaleaceae bacterium]|nr:hypothetical protein [Defluviitaleaceae bacterium]